MSIHDSRPAPLGQEKFARFHEFFRAAMLAGFDTYQQQVFYHIFVQTFIDTMIVLPQSQFAPVAINLATLSGHTNLPVNVLEKALMDLIRGQVLVPGGAGLYALNPDWQAWQHDSGEPRISPKTHSFVTMGQHDKPERTH